MGLVMRPGSRAGGMRAGVRLGAPAPQAQRVAIPASRALRAGPRLSVLSDAHAPRPQASGTVPGGPGDTTVGIVPFDQSGTPLPYNPVPTSGFAYDSDNLFTQEMGLWSPWLRSPDGEINLYRDRRVGRTRDVVRNDGWATGAVGTVTDNTIGAQFRLISRPDYAALARASGVAGFDSTWASEFGAVVESEFRLWADDPAHWCDSAQQLSLVQLFRLALRHKILDGEDLSVLLWRPEFIGAGAARYATTLQVVDPDRLSNPYEGPDTATMRGGVEIDPDGAPVAYHIRKAHQNDMFLVAESVTWERIPKQTEWGRPIVVHDFDRDRTAQNRGVSVLNPVLARLKMLGRYDAAELGQALLQTVMGTFVVSPYDASEIQAAMDVGPGQQWEMSAYQALRAQFHESRPVMAGGVRIPTLAPGERIDSIPPRSPTTNFGEFEHAILRGVAAATGNTAEEISHDYSKANYSSLRAAMLGAWRTMVRRRADFASGTATPIYGAFLEEMMERHPDILPAGAPRFMEQRAAYMRCRWIGPGRGWVDPVKERQGAVLGLDAGFGTLQDECAEISGADWREQLEQRAIEVGEFRRLGLKLPDWGAADPAHETDTRPQPQ